MFTKYILPVLAIAVSFAQPQGMGPGRGPGMGMGPGMGNGMGMGMGAGTQSFTELKAYLNLSDTQITSINNAVRTAAEANQALHTTIREKHTALQTLLNNGSTDANAIGKAMIEIRDLQKQITAAQAKIQEQALSFLTADQKTKLKALEDAEKLRPAIGQAHALHLLAPPANAGFGPMNGSGPRGFGGMHQ